MKKLMFLMLVGGLLVGASQAGIIMGGTTANGNLDTGTPYSGWTTAVPGDKFYLTAGTVGQNAYMGGWTVTRTRYYGGNNTIGFNDTGDLCSGTGDMVAFANSSDIDLQSDSVAVALSAGETLTISFAYAGGADDLVNNYDSRFTATAILIFDGGAATHTFTTTPEVDATNGAQSFSESVVLAANYSSVVVKIEMRNPGYGRAGFVDDVVLSSVPEPATMILLGLGGLLLRRRK